MNGIEDEVNSISKRVGLILHNKRIFFHKRYTKWRAAALLWKN